MTKERRNLRMSSWAQSNFHRVRNEVKARHAVPQGSLNESRWLTITNVTSPLTSHRDSLRDPFVAFAPRFLLGSSPVAHSLTRTSTSKSRCDFFAQNDIQWVCFVIIVRDGTSRRRPLPRHKNRDSQYAIPFIVYLKILLLVGIHISVCEFLIDGS